MIRRVVLCLFAAGMSLAFVFVVAGPSGADVTNTAPWPGSPTSPGGVNVWGECNEVLTSATPGSASWQNGYIIQIACQGEMPSDYTISSVSPSMPVIGLNSYGGGSWSSDAFAPAQWRNIGVTDSPQSGFSPIAGGSSCAASVSSTPSNELWQTVKPGSSGSLFSGYICTAGVQFPANTPAVVPGSNSGVDNPWYSATQVQALAEAPAATASNGHSMIAFSMYENFYENNSITCGGDYTCGSGSVFPAYQPETPLFQPGGEAGVKYCQGTHSMVSPGDDRYWDDGVSGDEHPAHSDEPALVVSNSGITDPYYSGGTGWSTNGYPLKLDSFTCHQGPLAGLEQIAPLPQTWFTGGSGSPSWPSECGLISVTAGYNLNGNGTEPPKLTSGQSYGVTVQYQGQVDELAIDPNDVSAEGYTTAFGDFMLGSDATVVPGSGSPQTLSFTPTATGTWNVQLYCMAAGQVFQWGYVGASVNGGIGTGGGNTEQCTTGGDGIQVCAPAPTLTGLAACFASAGWSLTDPVSWVTGALHDGVCILEWLFVPTPSTFAASAWASPFVTHVPGMWVADAIDATGTMFNGVNAGIASGTCSAPTIGATLPGSHPFNIQLPEPAACGGQAAFEANVGSVFGYRSIFRIVMVLLVWMAVFVVVWKMLPFSREGDGIEMLEGAGLNIDGDYIPTFWTNEGSD